LKMQVDIGRGKQWRKWVFNMQKTFSLMVFRWQFIFSLLIFTLNIYVLLSFDCMLLEFWVGPSSTLQNRLVRWGLLLLVNWSSHIRCGTLNRCNQIWHVGHVDHARITQTITMSITTKVKEC
jgi:hypothetical protein